MREFFIDNLSMHRAAFCVTSDVEALTQHKSSHRSAGLVIPEVTGELARRMRPAAAEHQLNMVIVGDVLWDRTAPANPDEGSRRTWTGWKRTCGGPVVNRQHPRGKVITDGVDEDQPDPGVRHAAGIEDQGRDHNGTMTVGCLATLYVRIPRGKR